MDADLEKSFDRSRTLLYGLLQTCLLEGEALESCPLEYLRNSLTLEEKYRYTISSSEKELNKILAQHEECFKKRVFASFND